MRLLRMRRLRSLTRAMLRLIWFALTLIRLLLLTLSILARLSLRILRVVWRCIRIVMARPLLTSGTFRLTASARRRLLLCCRLSCAHVRPVRLLVRLVCRRLLRSTRSSWTMLRSSPRTLLVKRRTLLLLSLKVRTRLTGRLIIRTRFRIRSRPRRVVISCVLSLVWLARLRLVVVLFCCRLSLRRLPVS